MAPDCSEDALEGEVGVVCALDGVGHTLIMMVTHRVNKGGRISATAVGYSTLGLLTMVGACARKGCFG